MHNIIKAGPTLKFKNQVIIPAINTAIGGVNNF